MNLDQPDNAVRLARLGAPRRLRLNTYTPEAAAEELSALLDSNDVISRCRTIAGWFASADPVGDTCRLIESVLLSPVPWDGAA